MKGILKNPVLIVICLACFFFGGTMIYLGFEQLFAIKISRPELYDTAPGCLWDYQLLEETSDGNRYQLEYSYYVGGAEYKLFKEAVLETEPELNKSIEVINDVCSPENGQISYRETYPMLILAGILTVFAPSVFLLGALVTSGAVDFSMASLLMICFGVMFAGFGFLFFYAMGDSFFPLAAFRKEGAIALFPTLFLASGVFLISNGLIHAKKEKQK